MHQFARGILAAVSTAFLVACGGGAAPDDAPTATAASQRHAPQRAARTVDAAALMDWAERTFPGYFPSHQANQYLGPYVYRAYGNGVYLGLDGQTVVVMGLLGPDRFAIVPVGTIADFACRVYPENCPVISGVAAKGLLNGATIGVYNMNADGSRGGLLASATTAADGRFSVTLPAPPAGPVLIEAAGGSYSSAYNGATIASQATLRAMLPAVAAAGESGVSVNPLTEMAASLTRTYLARGDAMAPAIQMAEQWVSSQYGLRSRPSRVIPAFDVTAVTANPEGVQLALVLAALDTLGHRLSPSNPDAIFASLSADFSDAEFDGRAMGGQQVTLNGSALPAGAGSSEFTRAFAVSFSGTSGGLRPAYLDAHFNAGTITENYQSRMIPVYVAAELAPYFPPTYSSPVPRTTTFNASATGYSCSSGAALTFDANGNPKCGDGPYYTCWGATVRYSSTGQVSCSDGGIPIYHATEIPVYTAPTIAPYTASTIEPYQAQTSIAQPAAGTPAIFRATAVHLLTEQERAAMAANDRAAGDAAAARVSSLGVPTPLQLEWMQRINDAVVASVRRTPYYYY